MVQMIHLQSRNTDTDIEKNLWIPSGRGRVIGIDIHTMDSCVHADTQLCLTRSSVHGIFPARILEWVANLVGNQSATFSGGQEWGGMEDHSLTWPNQNHRK